MLYQDSLYLIFLIFIDLPLRTQTSVFAESCFPPKKCVKPACFSTTQRYLKPALGPFQRIKSCLITHAQKTKMSSRQAQERMLKII